MTAAFTKPFIGGGVAEPNLSKGRQTMRGVVGDEGIRSGVLKPELTLRLCKTQKKI